MSSLTYRIGSNQVEAEKKCQFRDLDIQSDISCMEATSTVVAFVKEEKNMFISFPTFQLTYISDESIKSLNVSSQYIISIRGDASVEILRFNLDSENVAIIFPVHTVDRALPSHQLQ